MFEKHKEEKAAKEHAVAVAAWTQEDDFLKGLLSIVEQGGADDGGDVALVLKKGEHSVLQLGNGGLFEPQRGPGHYAGRSSGVSIPIGSTGMRYRIGQSRGTFIQGAENPTVIDIGTVAITDQRVVFIGRMHTVEWSFSKLIAIQHYENRPWTAIQVSNRAKVTGVTYDAHSEHSFRLGLEAAMSLFNHDTPALLGQLHEAINAHDLVRPQSAINN